MKAWHFLADNRLLKYGDRRLVEVGKTYESKGQIILCKNGMHGSVKVTDALKYAPGPILCRVEIEGNLEERDDKIAGRRRTVLAMEDVSKVLHLFAIDFAERALARVENPDPRSLKALEVKKLWLDGNATDKEIKEAWAAAEEAAWAASWAASWAAAWAAARAAAAEALDPARVAAWEATWEAREEEKEKQEECFLRLIQENYPELLK